MAEIIEPAKIQVEVENSKPKLPLGEALILLAQFQGDVEDMSEIIKNSNELEGIKDGDGIVVHFDDKGNVIDYEKLSHL
jgi:TusA-related sulfurtransferase